VELQKLSDEILMQRIAARHPEALGVLYDRYSRLVFSLALNAVGERSTAEEITQEVFLQVWKKAGTYRPERSKVVTWMSSIARYRSIDAWRRQSARPVIQADFWAEAGALTDPLDVELSVELRLRARQVRRAMAGLPPEQRQALALAFFQGYTHKEIAEALNTPLGTVKTRIRLAMQKMRKLLEEVSVDEGPI
jgi:RNA polymerase sigma-70 factor (ECF subfamily)